MKIIRVGLGERSYNIHVGSSNLSSIGVLCRELPLKGRAAIITNVTIAPLYLAAVRTSLEAEGYNVIVIELPDGEEFKTFATLEVIYDELIASGLDRGAFIVALGGGVIGDMAGFAAATFLRGIPFVQVPTTLLAQVDSSVGGKTGINHRFGKNLIGAFYQPSLVLIDLETMNTLPEREYLCGLAEALKYGIALDREFFDFMASQIKALKLRNKSVLQHVVASACSLKASVVEQDEREGGLRAVLNYGHTIGHAVETLAGYGAIKHGEAVAIGMAQIAQISFVKGFSTAAERDMIISLIAAFGLPIKLPDFTLSDYQKIIERDKKKRDDGVNFIFNQGIGNFVIEKVTDLGSLLSSCSTLV